MTNKRAHSFGELLDLLIIGVFNAFTITEGDDSSDCLCVIQKRKLKFKKC